MEVDETSNTTPLRLFFVPIGHATSFSFASLEWQSYRVTLAPVDAKLGSQANRAIFCEKQASEIGEVAAPISLVANPLSLAFILQ